MADETTLQVQETEKQEVESSGAERTRSTSAFIPSADIYENDEAVYLVCDLPGVSDESVDITLEENVLTINGYVDFTAPEGYQLAYAEYRVGDYQRRFAISNEIDQEHIEAKLNNGVLRLTLPKAKPEARKISIQAG
jgi:HSP20 family molecular chaperone IbpA